MYINILEVLAPRRLDGVLVAGQGGELIEVRGSSSGKLRTGYLKVKEMHINSQFDCEASVTTKGLKGPNITKDAFSEPFRIFSLV